jgi:hypothetical protein
MKCARLTLAICVTVLGCSGALACGRPRDWALIHSALPAHPPKGAFIAYVSIERAGVGRLYGTGLRANVRRVVQGEGRYKALILRSRSETSCDGPFANGHQGIIVAIPRGTSKGRLVVEPILAPGANGFRLLGRQGEP